MKFGVTIPNNWGVEDPHQVLSLGILAEELGYDSVWVMDHLLHTGFVRERLGDRPYYHPLAILSSLSATTSRVALGTSVLVLPYHNPVELAKYVATLDHMSRGRVLLGVGVGLLQPEFEALGVSMRQRGALTDESIAIMKELWTNPDPSFDSERWRFSDVQFWPKPVQQPHVPVWVGGTSPGARRRAALLGDGWHPNAGSPALYAAGREDVRAQAAAAGRDPDALTMSLRLDVGLPGVRSGDSAHRADAIMVSGENADQMVQVLGSYAAVGVEHVVLALNSGDVRALTQVMASIARDVMPHLR